MQGRFEITFDDGHGASFFEDPANESTLKLLEEMLWGLCQSLNMGHLPGVAIRVVEYFWDPTINLDLDQIGTIIRPIPGHPPRLLIVTGYIDLNGAQSATARNEVDGDFMEGRPVVATTSLLPERG